jgi:N-acetylglucosaminyldiphosphoundecaprenol N-acetyl-beta-D-mannosaminyltransferase
MDHIVKLRKSPAFRQAYDNANLVVVDGKPVWAVLLLLGESIPEVVPGSDLVPAIFNAVGKDATLTVFLLGAGLGIAEKAAENIEKKWPEVKVVGCYSPPFGFEKKKNELDKVANLINERSPDLLVVGLGAPKGVVWISRYAGQISCGVVLCAGATIDFISGETRRAPKWMQKISLEWLHRILVEPKRLLRRYIYDALVFPYIVLEEVRHRHKKIKSAHDLYLDRANQKMGQGKP